MSTHVSSTISGKIEPNRLLNKSTFKNESKRSLENMKNKKCTCRVVGGLLIVVLATDMLSSLTCLSDSFQLPSSTMLRPLLWQLV